jgi:arsenical pump membrane protein
MSPQAIIWVIAAFATAGVIIRPFNWPEAIWAVTGAALLVLSGLLSPRDALIGIANGTDVYLFLAGMMLLAEIARYEGLFDWLAAVATTWAKGSASRLFLLIYIVGTVVTTFLSNDATAVVLTPAVAAAVKTAKVERPLPYLLICAFVANAASFVLPISNPANLVVYGTRMPALLDWLPRYLLPSVLAIVATYLMLRWTQRAELRRPLAAAVPQPTLSGGGKAAALGITGTATALVVSSAFDVQLGLPTAIAGVLTVAFVLIRTRANPWTIIKDISWGVLPLVAGLFVLVQALDATGLIGAISGPLRGDAADSEVQTAWAVGVVVAFAANLMNNLPAGLIAGTAMQSVNAPDLITRAILIGVNLGPNLSVSGSLATILWLAALRRDGHDIGAFRFMKLGLLIMPPALLLALGGALLFGPSGSGGAGFEIRRFVADSDPHHYFDGSFDRR